MKKVKKRTQTVEIPAGDEGAPVGGIDGADAEALEDSDLLVEESDSLEETDPGVPEAAAAFDQAEELTPVRPVGLDGIPLEVSPETSWDGPTTEGDVAELAALREASRGERVADGPSEEGAVDGAAQEGAVDGAVDLAAEGGQVADADAGVAGEGLADVAAEGPAEGEVEAPAVDSAGRLESILESLLFASDRLLGLSDLKRLVNQRDGKVITAALERLQERHRDTGIQLVAAGGGWQFRTHVDNAPWVSKLVAGRPARLSRAMLETLAIVAYRQPITRPEIDEIRGVDCGPVLKTLLDRALIRMIGKKEEVGRPILYGTTPEFLRTFSLKDLTELPTLREFHELGLAEQAEVEAKAPRTAGAAGGAADGGDAGAAPASPDAAAAPIPSRMPAPTALPDIDPDEEDTLLAELDEATSAAARATKAPDAPPAPTPDESPPPAPEGAE
jgi:segregation and condensation protein B